MIRQFERFDEPISSCAWVSDGLSLVLGAFDSQRSLCTWSLKGERLYTWTKKVRTEDLALSPDGRWLVAMDDQHHIYVYDFVTRDLKYEMELASRPTSVSITGDSKYLLVNKQDGEAQLFNIINRAAVQKYTGHIGGDYLIRSDFGGANESFVISGSEGQFALTSLDSFDQRLTSLHDFRWLCVHLAQVQRPPRRKAGGAPTTL